MKRFTASFIATICLVVGIEVLSASTAYAASADLTLSPVTQTINAGEQADIAVELNTGGANSSDTDLYINFDATKVILVDILPGTIYDQYIGEEIDNAQGRASISGLASKTENLFSGTGTFATLRFKGTGAGTTAITIDFTLGQRNDSNVVDFQTNEDILATTTNASLTVLGAAATLTPTQMPTPTLTNDASNLPETAHSLPTYILSISSISLIALGSLFFKFSR